MQRRRAVWLLCYLTTLCLPAKALHPSHNANTEKFSHTPEEETPQQDYLFGELEASRWGPRGMEDKKQRGFNIAAMSTLKTVEGGLLEDTRRESGTLEVIRERRDLIVHDGRGKTKERLLEGIRENKAVSEVIRERRDLIVHADRGKTKESLLEGTRENEAVSEVIRETRDLNVHVGGEKTKEERLLEGAAENEAVSEVIRERRDLNVPHIDKEKTKEHLNDKTLKENEALEIISKRRKIARKHFIDEINTKNTRERRKKPDKRSLDENTVDSNTRIAGEKVRKKRTSGASQTHSKERNHEKTLKESGLTSSRGWLECTTKSSCSSRDRRQDIDVGSMSPCMCDDQCYVYGDCCHDHTLANHTAPALRPTCMPLVPAAGRPYALFPRSVFLVNWCPEGSEPNLKDRCEGKGSPNYLKDIPVFSKTTGIGYANIFCASCHNDMDIYKYNIYISCSGTVNDTSDIENMIYHPGELRWTYPDGVSEGTTCLLDVIYPPSTGRWCQSELVDACQKNWTIEEDVRRCSAYNYYVQSGDKVYKNKDCAHCNGVPHNKLQCLSSNLRFGTNIYVPPSLLELFEVRGDCKDDEVWDLMYRRCEHVACGFLFTLQDGKCERSNATMEVGQSYLNASCYVVEYCLNDSIVFPNQSIYLNETQRLYLFGEYEFNGSLIRVCDEMERWTPFMQILSSVLILISLVCLLAHMAIFLMLPERRNIPSMNLFSMTVSLFMAEFIFLTFFRLKFNHITCVASGVLMYYFLSVSFLWMNVMSIDIFRTFYYTSSYRTKSRKIFTQYSLYAWILPIGGVTVALVVDEVWPDLVIAPHFGTDTCWMNNKWGLVAFFTFPSGMVILANLVLYMVSVRNIYTQIKSGEMASSTIRKSDGSSKYSTGNSRTSVESSGRKVSRASSQKSNGSESPNCKERLRNRFTKGFLRKHRGRLILYCKLALIMGMTWIFAFISIHTKSIVFEYLFIIFNGLQGAFIFVAFDLKKKVWEELSNKTCCLKRRGEYSGRGKSGQQLTASTESGYRSKPYSQRFDGWRPNSASLGVSRSQPSHSTAEMEV